MGHNLTGDLREPVVTEDVLEQGFCDLKGRDKREKIHSILKND